MKTRKVNFLENYGARDTESRVGRKNLSRCVIRWTCAFRQCMVLRLEKIELRIKKFIKLRYPHCDPLADKKPSARSSKEARVTWCTVLFIAFIHTNLVSSRWSAMKDIEPPYNVQVQCITKTLSPANDSQLMYSILFRALCHIGYSPALRIGMCNPLTGSIWDFGTICIL